jgi:hypothetical protein
MITITATPASGSRFDHWDGDVLNLTSATTVVTMDGSKTVTACFAAVTVPCVTSTKPTDGATATSLKGRIAAVFNNSMKAESITTATFVAEDSGGNAVGGTVAYDPTTRVASFLPSSYLAANTTYTATISTGVKDIWGYYLSNDYTWTLTTRAGGIFVEDFESPETVESNWSPYGAAFSVSNSIGTLVTNGSVVPVKTGHDATFHDKGDNPVTFGDLVYEVDVKLTSKYRVQLCFGADSEGRRMFVGYDIGSVNYNWNNDLENSLRETGVCSVLEDYRPYDQQWHRWRVEVSGAQFDFWIDDHHIITGQLEGYLPGPIGMRSWYGANAQFDNLVVA